MYDELRALGVYGSAMLIEDMEKEREKAILGIKSKPELDLRNPTADYHPQARTRHLYLVRGSGASE